MGQAEFASYQVEHGDEVNGGAVTASLSFNGAKHAVEPFHKGVGQTPLPMSQDSRQMVLHQLRRFEHGAKDPRPAAPCHPAHPAAPSLKASLGYLGAGTAVDVLQDQAHLICFRGIEVLGLDLGQADLLLGTEVLGSHAPSLLILLAYSTEIVEEPSSQS